MNYFKYQEELEKILTDYEIDKNDICLVGSIVLSILGLRNHNDIDFVILESKRNKITDKIETFSVSPNIELVRCNWARLIGLTDEDLVTNQLFHNKYNGFKIVKPEVLFSVATKRKREKDKRAVKLLQKYATESDTWDWGLVARLISNDNKQLSSTHKKASFLKYYNIFSVIKGINKLKKLIKYVKRFLKQISEQLKLRKLNNSFRS